MENKSITDFFNKEYKDYSLYTIENRAIPSYIDSFKSVQRKVIYTAIKTVSKVSNKVSTLAGNVIVLAKHHHGNVSCEDAIVSMAQDFKNNLPLFNRIGQFGSLKSPFSSASRYISISLSDVFHLVFKDDELLINKIDENDAIEPFFYLPIIPVVLLNGGGGVAVAFSTIILNREPKTLIKDCISYLNGKKIGKLVPHINDFNGIFKNDVDNHKKWYISGLYEITNSTTITLTELPPSMTYEKIETHLDVLLDKGLIKNWINNGKGKGVINYQIKMDKDKLSTLLPTEIDKMFKLTDQITENFTVLDEHGKLKIFDSAEDILKHFVDFRLTYYQKRKDYQLNKLTLDISKMDNRSKFIKCVIDGKIVVNNKKKEDIIKQITANKIDMIDDSYDYLLSMPIYSLSKEKLDELLLNIKTKKAEQVVIKKSDNKETYINELTELLTILTKKEKENK